MYKPLPFARPRVEMKWQNPSRVAECHGPQWLVPADSWGGQLWCGYQYWPVWGLGSSPGAGRTLTVIPVLLGESSISGAGWEEADPMEKVEMGWRRVRSSVRPGRTEGLGQPAWGTAGLGKTSDHPHLWEGLSGVCQVCGLSVVSNSLQHFGV